jgi:Cytochrome P460
MNRSLKVPLVTGAAIALSGSLLGIGALALSSSNETGITPTANSAADENASPIYGVTIPAGYREWQAITPSFEAPPLDELRLIFGNPAGFQAFREDTLPFPHGTILAKVAWKRVPSTFFATASFPGQATTVQFMVKDSKKYAATGGWGLVAS